LPVEVINTLFTCLLPQEVVAAGAVSRAWRRLTKSQELWAIFRRILPLPRQLRTLTKIVERRSKGKLFKCELLGTNEQVLMRTICLDITNAGKDDGVPTSLFREYSTLAELQHPNIAKLYGIDVLDLEVQICTEYVEYSFREWFTQLPQSPASRSLGIRSAFRQLCEGLAYMHHQGIFHRNLKADNVFIDKVANGTVKIADFATSRAWEYPLQAYTPEDPKERDRSGREARRLWYSAPERILRLKRYGPEVDMWAVGCLLVEAAVGDALFPSESEIEHLFKVFRFVGTPDPMAWPDILLSKCWTARFPVYKTLDLHEIATKSAEQLQPLLEGPQGPVAAMMLQAASVIGESGCDLLSRLVCIPPHLRLSAAEAMGAAYFTARTHEPHVAEPLVARPAIEQSLRSSCEGLKERPRARGRREAEGEVKEEKAEEMEEKEVEDDRDTPNLGELRISTPGKRCSVLCPWCHNDPGFTLALAPACTLWTSMEKMRAKVRPQPVPEYSKRAKCIDWMFHLAKVFELSSFTVHVAVNLLDQYLAAKPEQADNLALTAVSCVKLADVFSEISKEYYKQDNAKEYAEMKDEYPASFSDTQFGPAEIVAMEKEILRTLGFDLHVPTLYWFTSTLLCVAGYEEESLTRKIVCFLADLVLLDNELQSFPVFLVSQVCMVMGVFFAQRAIPGAPSTEEHCDVALAQWMKVPARIRHDDSVEVQMCWNRMVHVVSTARRAWKLEGLEAVEVRHSPTALKLSYPPVWPSFPLKYLSGCERIH
jgi:serine/threonine protein kinase